MDEPGAKPQPDVVYRDPNGTTFVAESKVATPAEIRQAYAQAQGMIAKLLETTHASNVRITEEQRSLWAFLETAPSDTDRIHALERANAAIAANFTIVNEQLAELAKPQELIRAAGEALERQVEVNKANGIEQ